MHNGEIELARYRLSMAKEKLDAAGVLLESKNYKDSVGRSYYAIFTSVRAILALDGEDFKRHSGVIQYFQRNYVKTKIFDVRFSKYLDEAFLIRNNTDYADFFIVARDDAEKQYLRAKEFFTEVENYLDDRIENGVKITE